MKIAVKPDQNLPIGPQGSVAFIIPEVLGISPQKILQNRSIKNAWT